MIHNRCVSLSTSLHRRSGLLILVIGGATLLLGWSPLSSPFLEERCHIANDHEPTHGLCHEPVPCQVHVSLTNATQQPDHMTLGMLDTLPLASLDGWNKTKQRNFCGREKSWQVFKESGIGLRDLMEFQPCSLFNLIQRKTVWLIGDSQMYGLFMAASYFLRSFAKTPDDVDSKPIGIPCIDEALRLKTEKPGCVHFANYTRVCHIRIVRLQHEGWLNITDVTDILASAFPDFQTHIVVLNAGLHYYFVPQKLGLDMQAFARERRLTTRESWPRILWVDTPPQHFNTPRGGYNFTMKDTLAEQACAPLSEDLLRNYNDRGDFNAISDEFVPSVSDGHVKTWEVSKRAYYAHVDRAGDCTHYCRPGVPELWLYLLTKTLSTVKPVC